MTQVENAAAGEVTVTQADDGLWCLHALGFDEVHPAPDRATAQLWAAQWTVWNQRRNPTPDRFEPVVSWIVARWPHDADSHAEGLARSVAGNTFPVDPLTASTPPVPDVAAIPVGWTLTERQLDDDCGCPEEFWDTPHGVLHMHLSAGKPSNACLDNGDEGEWHTSITTATVDEARVAFIGWAIQTAHAKPVSTPAAIPVGMKPWYGGHEAPHDYGGTVRFRDGETDAHEDGIVFDWRWACAPKDDDIIAYTPKPAPVATGSGDALREALGDASDWSEMLAELYTWTGSAWLSGERGAKPMARELHEFLCRLIGYLTAGEDAAAALSATHPTTAADTGSTEGVELPWSNVGELAAWIEATRNKAFLNGARGEEISTVEATVLLSKIATLTADKPEAQGLRVPDRFANDAAAKVLYDSWSDHPGWVPWVERGNSDMQEEARRLAARSGAE